ncbi:hypothetical protein IPU70_06475 [Achromobacter sp. SD115]|uniref:hypothetical protein n=1 Tax=Achromobacter sp. SD115 TaxID=2782011 RepID=UPI001A9573B7|nr:hypothetical protein [Achromobacter sp. SD115]
MSIVHSPVPKLFLAALLATAAMAAQAHPVRAAYGVEVCTVTGTSGEYSVRVRNIGTSPLARAEINGVSLDSKGNAAGPLTVNLTDIPPGKYKTAVLGRPGNGAALVSIATYISANGAETHQQDLFAGKVAHVSPGSALRYTLAPLAVRGWTVAYGTKQDPKLEAGSAVLLIYPVTLGKKRDATRPDAGRAPADVVPLAPCGAAAGAKKS